MAGAEPVVADPAVAEAAAQAEDVAAAVVVGVVSALPAGVEGAAGGLD